MEWLSENANELASTNDPEKSQDHTRGKQDATSDDRRWNRTEEQLTAEGQRKPRNRDGKYRDGKNRDGKQERTTGQRVRINKNEQCQAGKRPDNGGTEDKEGNWNRWTEIDGREEKEKAEEAVSKKDNNMIKDVTEDVDGMTHVSTVNMHKEKQSIERRR